MAVDILQLFTLLMAGFSVGMLSGALPTLGRALRAVARAMVEGVTRRRLGPRPDYPRIQAMERDLGLSESVGGVAGRLTCAACGAVGVYEDGRSACPSCAVRYDAARDGDLGLHALGAAQRAERAAMADRAGQVFRDYGYTVGDFTRLLHALNGVETALSETAPAARMAQVAAASRPLPPPSHAASPTKAAHYAARVVVMDVETALASADVRREMGAGVAGDIRRLAAWQANTSERPLIAAVAATIGGRVVVVNIQFAPVGMKPLAPGERREADYYEYTCAEAIGRAAIARRLTPVQARMLEALNGANMRACVAYTGASIAIAADGTVAEPDEAGDLPIILTLVQRDAEGAWHAVMADGGDGRRPRPATIPLGAPLAVDH